MVVRAAVRDEQLQDLAANERIEPGRRFVEQQHLGVSSEREEEQSFGLLAARQAAGALRRIQIELANETIGQFRIPGTGKVLHPSHVPADRLVAIERHVVGHEARRCLMARSSAGIGRPRIVTVPGVGPDQADHDSQNGRFAGAVRSNETEHSSGRHG